MKKEKKDPEKAHFFKSAIPAILFGIYVILDYLNVPQLLGLSSDRINMDFFDVFLNSVIVIVLYIITYFFVDSRQIQKDANAKDTADVLLLYTYKECLDNLRMVGNIEWVTLLSLYWDEGRREIERFSKESTTPCKGKTTSYNPLTTVSAQDVIRVVMAYAFDRARLKYGYKLLRGADFDRKGAVDENLRTTRFDILKERLPDVLDVHSWHEFIKAIMNAGYLSGEMILSGNAIFYTYALYLIAKHRFHASYNEDMHLTSLWFFYASLVSLYTGSFESTVEKHLNTIKGLKTLSEYKEFILSRINERLTNDFFDITLVGSEGLAVSGRGNNAWNAYVASLNIMNAKILFSKSNLFVSKLFEPGTDGNRKSLEKHHLFPKAYLKSLNCTDAKINQMANYALIDWKDNMDILNDPPSVYYPIICAGMSDEQIRVMEEENALPHGWENMSYDDFLIERRKLMAAKIKIAFEVLKKAVTE